MPRVHELAQELGLTSREVMDHLRRVGHPVYSHTEPVPEEVAAAVRKEVPAPEPSTATQVMERPLVTDTTHRVPDATDARATEVEPSPAAPPGERPPDERVTQGTGPGGVDPGGSRKRRSWTSHLAELPVLVFFAFIIAIVIKTFLAQAFFIPSESMLPTLDVGDRVIVEKVSYRFGSPARGHVVVFAQDAFGEEPPDLPWWDDARIFLRELIGLPTGRFEDYIKRVVGVGGDVISYRGQPRQLSVNGEEIDEPYVRGGEDQGSQALAPRDCERLEMDQAEGGCVVPAGMIFVMGDNRGNSEDSRVIGPIPEDKVVGRAFAVIWPLGNFGGL